MTESTLPPLGVVDGRDVSLDLQALTGSHLCIVANSGGGKSGAMRRVLETTHGRIQHIILDVEDEFYTLRERFDDYLIVGGDGADAPATIAGAPALARTALEHGLSLIIQLNDFGDRAPEYVAAFLASMMSAPRDLWHPVIIAIDEVQRFAPSSGATDATAAVKDLLYRGRKRGFTALAASLRISEIDPGVRGMFNNWMLGRVGTTLDRDTARKQLGFSAKEGSEKMAAIVKRHFWSTGPAISDQPIYLRVADTATTIVQAGQAKIPTPPAPDALRDIISALAKPVDQPEATLTETGPRDDAVERALRGRVDELEAIVAKLDHRNAELNLRLDRISALADVSLPIESTNASDGAEVESAPADAAAVEAPAATGSMPPPRPVVAARAPFDGKVPPNGRALEVLQVLAGAGGKGMSEKAWAFRCGIDRKSSTWRGHKAKLRGWFSESTTGCVIQPDGLYLFPSLPAPLSSRALVVDWIGRVPGGSGKILHILLNAWPDGRTRAQLGDDLRVDTGSSTFRGYLAPLNTLDLIEKTGPSGNPYYKLAQELMDG